MKINIPFLCMSLTLLLVSCGFEKESKSQISNEKKENLEFGSDELSLQAATDPSFKNWESAFALLTKEATFFKRRPLHSQKLNDEEKCEIPEKAYIFFNKTAKKINNFYFQLTLAESIEGCGFSEGYLYLPDIVFLHKVELLQNTHFKFRLMRAQDLEDKEKCLLTKGTRLYTSQNRLNTLRAHRRLNLTQPQPGCDFEEGYLYSPNVGFEQNPYAPSEVKFASLEPSWKTDWNFFVANALDKVAPELINSVYPNDIGILCPNYINASDDDKKAIWALIFASIAKFESNFNPNTVFNEPPPLNKPSLGLLQISYGDERHKGCLVDANLQNARDPQVNLQCGVAIMRNQLKVRGTLFTTRHYYWSVLTNKQEQIKAFFKRYSSQLGEACAAQVK